MTRGSSAEEPAPAAKTPRFRFYAMDTGLGGPDVPKMEDKVALLKKLGYVGIDYWMNPKTLPQMLDLLDKHEPYKCALPVNRARHPDFQNSGREHSASHSVGPNWGPRQGPRAYDRSGPLQVLLEQQR